jgi:hypothetical protein
VTIQPGDETAGEAGRDHLRASHADRERVIGTLKAAYVQGMLTKDELDLRLGRAFGSRTYADLATLTADIPAQPAAAGPARPPARVRRRPLARTAAGSGGCLVIAAAATWAWILLVSDDGHYHGIPGANPSYESWAPLALILAFTAVVVAFGIMANGVATSLEQRRPRRQLPPRPGPGGHALDGEQRGTGHGPVPPGPGDGQAPTELRAHKPPRRIPARTARAPRGVRPAQGAPGIPAPVPRAT